MTGKNYTDIFDDNSAVDWLDKYGQKDEKGDTWFYQKAFIYGISQNKSLLITGLQLVKNEYLRVKPFRYVYALFELAYMNDGLHLNKAQFEKKLAETDKISEDSKEMTLRCYSMCAVGRDSIKEDEFMDAVKSLIRKEKVKSFDRNVLRAIKSRENDDIEGSDKILQKYIHSFKSVDDNKKPLSLAQRSKYSMDRYHNSSTYNFETFSKRLNFLTGGGWKGETWICAGYSSDGKTTLVKELSYDAMKFGDHGLFVSLEMQDEELEMIYHARMAYDMGYPELTFEKIRRRQLNEEELEKYRAVVKRFEEYKNLIIYQPEGKFTMDDLEILIDKIDAYMKLDFVVIDYLELIDPDQHYESVRVRVKEIMRRAKRLATRKNIWVIIPHQISRKGREKAEKRHEPYYEMSDLQESSGVEQNCVVMIWIYQDDNFREVNRAKIGVAKNRMGAVDREGWEIGTDFEHCRLYEGGMTFVDPMKIHKKE